MPSSTVKVSAVSARGEQRPVSRGHV